MIVNIIKNNLLLFQIILDNGQQGMQTQNSFAHGQVISFNDGQAIIVQNPDQSGGHQSMF